MQNYDPDFTSKIKNENIIISGYNFGCGSSREQAVTSLKYNRIKFIIAASFNHVYLRNAINNGVICIESPELWNDVKDTNKLTEINGSVTIDFTRSEINYKNKHYQFSPIQDIVQDIIIKSEYI